ncbi:ADP-ribosylglycohydrolase [Saccharothrix tamanrassetensis]|uniref:ADP-ribosylglycohydrolase n=1 Tax=Saccharothrix tamanrassetensis TaxID=1051531 RepID=A0A841CR25_9PSEU|nr:ADP-ribosylglycohydrolase family protein [Saccharothrix tamanrassetensis]MBB5957946.1 ADP-ribosylglycohydrolase [Saccharothrix tamanrassetensis]
MLLSDSDLAVLARLVRAQADAPVVDAAVDAVDVLRVELHIGVDAAGRRFLTRGPVPASPDALRPSAEPPGSERTDREPPGSQRTGSASASTGSAPAPAPAGSAPAAGRQPTSERVAPDAGRWRGCLLAGAVADALGAPVEAMPMERIRELAGPRGVTGMLANPDGVGRITDDTQMTLFTLEGLIRAHTVLRREGRADVAHSLQMAYQRWLHTQGTPWPRARGPRDSSDAPDGWLVRVPGLFKRRAPGATCFFTLQEYGKSGRTGSVARPPNDSKGCGGVMRAAPVALWSDDPDVVFEVAAESAAITHGHPSGYLPAGVLAVTVHGLLRGASLRDALDAARARLVRWDRHDETSAALDAALSLEGPPTPERVARLGDGAVGESALAIAVYAAVSTDGLGAALLASVNHGGDSDSTGAVCGNLVGALYGEDAIDPLWLAQLELRDVVTRLADDALVEFGPVAPTGGDWAVRYPTH